MSFYLRVEAVNLSHFINDTNDLSTIRGGSLLLLEAMDMVEVIIKNNLPKKVPLGDKKITELKNQLKVLTSSKSTKTSRKKIKSIENIINNESSPDSTLAITKGASWGLFNLDVNHEGACKIQDCVNDLFKNDARYKHATFVVDLHLNNGDKNYKTDRNCLQTLNHWQQMQSPSLAICREGTTSCAIDKMRPAINKQWLKAQEKDKDYVSESVYQRREYGRDQKQMFYEKITGSGAKYTYTQDLDDLSKSAKKGILDGKIAFIYIDGNGFGDIQRSSKTAVVQKQFDENTRHGREKLLTAILEKIRNYSAIKYNGTQMTRMVMMNAECVKRRAYDFSRILQKILLNHNDLRHQRSIF